MTMCGGASPGTFMPGGAPTAAGAGAVEVLRVERGEAKPLTSSERAILIVLELLNK